MRDPQAWKQVMEGMQEALAPLQPEVIVGIGSARLHRWHRFGDDHGLGLCARAQARQTPWPDYAVDYALEYGSDRLEIQEGALSGCQRVLVVDDLLATGGTAAACAELVSRAGGAVCGYGFVAGAHSP